MNALLIVAHGSRRETSNEEVRELTSIIKVQSADRFDSVDCAFLELADPSIPDGLMKLINSGATRITVVPYFLSAGRHVVEDIPGEVAKVSDNFPDIRIQIAPYLGAAAGVARLLLDQAGIKTSL